MSYSTKDKLLAIQEMIMEPNNIHPIWQEILEEMAMYYEEKQEETKTWEN